MSGRAVAADRRCDAATATLLLNTVLGGGMSSRLFQTIREERGLAYSIYSDLNPYRTPARCVCMPELRPIEALQVIELVMEEFRRLKQEPLPEDELRRAKDQLLGNIILSMESTGARMSNLARQEMYFNHFFGIDEVMQQVEQVTAEQAHGDGTGAVRSGEDCGNHAGRLDGIKVGREDLAC